MKSIFLEDINKKLVQLIESNLEGVEMYKTILIAEKDSQAESIADALGLSECSMAFTVPTKESPKIQSKIRTQRKRMRDKEKRIKDIETKYTSKGKDFTSLKSYQKEREKLDEYKRNLKNLLDEMEIERLKSEKRNVTYWKDDERILISATGHLIGVKLIRSRMESSEEFEEEEEQEEEEDDDGYTIIKSEHETDELNFETDWSAPKPAKEELNRWLKLKLIEHFLKETTYERIICATDFDREGQSIFGTIIEYFNLSFNICLRMKFSSLEPDVLREAYEKLIPFDIDLYESGKARRWMDFVIGYNLNPAFARIYREGIMKYLEEQGVETEIINKVKYNNTFNMGRVKLVILKYINDFTQEQVDEASNIEKPELQIDGRENFEFSFTDNDGVRIDIFVVKEDDEIAQQTNLDGEYQFDVEDVSYKDVQGRFPFDGEEVPTFLNLTKVFEICEPLGATTQEINRILEFLYLQKYTSYPRSKSEKWEIDDDIDRVNYADSVLTALGNIGYPVKSYYFGTGGNEGSTSHSHPCIHPLHGVTKKKVEKLKRTNPLAYLVFNEICLHTLKCFEKLPVVKFQEIVGVVRQNNSPSFRTTLSNGIEILETNILDFTGISYSYEIIKKIEVEAGDEFDVNVERKFTIMTKLDKNRETIELLNDFDVIKFLNENDIGTDATRAPLLSELIQLQYLFSERVLITTFLGTTMNLLAERYVNFIDIDYTLDIEKKLNEVESGISDVSDFETFVKDLLIKAYNTIQMNKEEIKEVFLDVPTCEIHNVPLIIRAGKFGRYLVCPKSFTEEKCNQRVSI